MFDKEIQRHSSSQEGDRNVNEADLVELQATNKTTWERLWPVIACGAGLFSDGYLNSVAGPVNTILGIIYKERYKGTQASKNIPSLVFAGTVVGQLFFAWTSDKYSRKWSLLASTIILIVFAALSTGAYGAGGSLGGLLAALTAYRFLLGVGIGGEYPAGSVAAAESTGELKKGTRNRFFVLFTNTAIDAGFIVGAIVPMILVLICSESHLRAVWRVALGLGVVPPLSLLYLRIKLKEPEEFNRESMKHAKTPYLLCLKFYWWRLLCISVLWFIYDFSAYSFGIYGSSILAVILGDTAPLWKTLGWNTLLNVFYMPGSILGAFASDWFGPKQTLAVGVAAQAVVAFIMAGCYAHLATPTYIGAFVVVYGIFLSMGEFGPGDNLGLVASKSCATSVRGRFYGIAASVGKIGAFAGSYAFPVIQANAPTKLRSGQDPFFVSGSLCVLSALIAFFLLPEISQDTITEEDIKFRAYLGGNGWDTRQMGEKGYHGRSASTAEGKA
ncbi:MAG: hypothetical protein M1814_006143 [Vezdaea aestivalis]|nr:MAG: hypothetical protein M1814_006143 [Vezdaea aestivalis]